MAVLSNELIDSLNLYNEIIQQRLKEFQNIKGEFIFYEFCFCILTPQSSAKNAWKVQNILIERDFKNNPFDPTDILSNTQHYIRFHNIKSQRLLYARDLFPTLANLLATNIDKYQKRKFIKDNFTGLGMKEASHFLRNIGYRDLAIIDRHILRNLHNCNVIEDITPPKNEKQYLDIEKKYLEFAIEVGMEMDVLDLLFFAHSTGEVLK